MTARVLTGSEREDLSDELETIARSMRRDPEVSTPDPTDVVARVIDARRGRTITPELARGLARSIVTALRGLQ